MPLAWLIDHEARLQLVVVVVVAAAAVVVVVVGVVVVVVSSSSSVPADESRSLTGAARQSCQAWWGPKMGGCKMTRKLGRP